MRPKPLMKVGAKKKTQKLIGTKLVKKFTILLEAAILNLELGQILRVMNILFMTHIMRLIKIQNICQVR